jgi:RimJ/RimL family protein N-acetyltransferase
MGRMEPEPVTLMGKFVRLDPLSEAHIPSLAEVGLEPEIWRFMRYGKVETEAQLRVWVRELLDQQAQGTDLPFTVIKLDSGKAAGCTRYLDIDIPNRSLEIGGTWYGLEYQGTMVNTECKYLLLKHAFETLACVRVWFKADHRNLRSIHALEGLGAQKEGVLRNHMILPDGYIRDSVMFSILPEEWPHVKQKLEAKLYAS